MHELPDFAAQERSLLKIEPIGIPPYSVRGVRQTFTPLPAEIHYTVNGKPVNFTPPQFRQYTSTISCRDVDVPALDGVWPGDVMTIDCVHELRGRLSTDAEPYWPQVSGSYYEEDGFYYYRPILVMMFVNWNTQLAEWDGQVVWAMEFTGNGPLDEATS